MVRLIAVLIAAVVLALAVFLALGLTGDDPAVAPTETSAASDSSASATPL